MEGTITFMVLLDVFQPVFTQPSFATFRLLMTGWILSHRHRFVTDLILSSDSVGHGHFSDYHRFFSQARWSIDRLWQLLAGLLIKTFFGSDAVILLAGDDTLCRKRGLGLFGAGMHHDPLISSKAKKLVSWGHDWVTLALVIVNPWWAPTKVFSLPIAMRLYRNRQGALVDDDTVRRYQEEAKTEQDTAEIQRQIPGCPNRPTGGHAKDHAPALHRVGNGAWPRETGADDRPRQPESSRQQAGESRCGRCFGASGQFTKAQRQLHRIQRCE